MLTYISLLDPSKKNEYAQISAFNKSPVMEVDGKTTIYGANAISRSVLIHHRVVSICPVASCSFCGSKHKSVVLFGADEWEAAVVDTWLGFEVSLTHWLALSFPSQLSPHTCIGV